MSAVGDESDLIRQRQYRPRSLFFRHQAIDTLTSQCGINRVRFVCPARNTHNSREMRQVIERHAK